jgi:hypothetical protein
MRSMTLMPSIIDLVARSHSATTSVSPVPRRSIALRPALKVLARHLLREELVDALGPKGSDLPIEVLPKA